MARGRGSSPTQAARVLLKSEATAPAFTVLELEHPQHQASEPEIVIDDILKKAFKQYLHLPVSCCSEVVRPSALYSGGYIRVLKARYRQGTP